MEWSGDKADLEAITSLLTFTRPDDTRTCTGHRDKVRVRGLWIIISERASQPAEAFRRALGTQVFSLDWSCDGGQDLLMRSSHYQDGATDMLLTFYLQAADWPAARRTSCSSV